MNNGSKLPQNYSHRAISAPGITPCQCHLSSVSNYICIEHSFSPAAPRKSVSNKQKASQEASGLNLAIVQGQRKRIEANDQNIRLIEQTTSNTSNSQTIGILYQNCFPFWCPRLLLETSSAIEPFNTLTHSGKADVFFFFSLNTAQLLVKPQLF